MTWLYLAKNPNDNAIKLLMNIFGDKLNEYADSKFWINLSTNPSNEAIKLLLKNVSNINWKMLSTNPNDKAIELLKQNNKIDWNYLSTNPNYEAVKLLEKNKDKFNDMINLSTNTNDEALKLFDFDYVNYHNKTKLINNLSSNTSDYAIELLNSIATLEEFNWVKLSKNPGYEAVKLLKKHQDYINWHSLSENPKIFEEIPNSRFVH